MVGGAPGAITQSMAAPTSLLESVRVRLDAGQREGGAVTIIAGWLLAARARWPTIDLDAAAFVEFVAARVDPTVDLAVALEALQGVELYLVGAVLAGRPGAMREFRATLAIEVSRVRRRLDDESAHDELLQAVTVKLLVACGEAPPKLSEFSGVGTLRRWLRVVVLRTHLDMTRASNSRPEVRIDDEALAGLPALDADPELAYLKAHYRDAVRCALMTAWAALPAPRRALLRQHYLEGLRLEQIATLYGVHRVTASRRLAAARAALAAATRDRLAAAAVSGEDEVDSVLRLVVSNLEISLRRLLAA
jgi:RNA polymerase sigma-70 factor (ECF subfamily)